MIAVRQAASTDIPLLQKLAVRSYCDAFGADFIPSDLTAHIRKNLSTANLRTILARDIVLVAEDESKLVGFVQFGDARLEGATPGKDKEIYRLYVLSGHQNNGIGSLLLNVALHWFNNQKAERVFLDVWEDNEHAIRFYRHHGFEVVGKRAFTVASGARTGFDLIMACPIKRSI